MPKVDKKLTLQQRKESNALTHLQTKHHYMFQGIKRDDDRWTNQFRRDKKTGKQIIEGAVKVILIVPMSSHLGGALVDMYKAKDKAKKRSKRA